MNMFEMDKEAFRFGATSVENSFILDYLPHAKGDHVKVYLWCLMKVGAGEAFTVEEMSRDLYLSVPDIEAALRYWERRALCVRLQDNPPKYRFYSPTQQSLKQGTPLMADDGYVEFAENVYALFGERRKITPSEIALAWEWVEEVGLSQEVVLMLLSHCITQRGVQFALKNAEPLAVRMKEENVIGCDDADVFLRHEQAVHDGAKKVLARMGKRRKASEDELNLYRKWVKEWQFDMDAVLNACAEMTKGDPSFGYLDGILNGLRSRSTARTGVQLRQHMEQEQKQKEQYMQVFSLLKGRVPATARRLYDQWVQIQPHDVLVQAVRYAGNMGFDLVQYEGLLEQMKALGIAEGEKAEKYLQEKMDDAAFLRKVFARCGHRGAPAPADRKLLQKWRGMGMNDELILQAAEQAAMAEGSKMAYLDKVLQAWQEAGVTDVSQARPAKKPASGKAKQVSAQNYGQREYTEEQLDLVSNDLFDEVRKNRG